MIPLRDSEATRHLTFANTFLILSNIAVFALEVQASGRLGAKLAGLAMVPRQVVTPHHVVLETRVLATLVTSQFLHAGFAHIAGNMLYLFIFGPAVEQRMGPIRYLCFYLLGGIIAALAMVAMGPESRVPVIGASGAIAGVLGAYLVLYPGGRILTIWPFFGFLRLIEVPALLYLLIWFAVQLYSGIASGAAGPLVGGVAWWAHVGGFLFGVATAPLLARRPRRSAAPYRTSHRTRIGSRHR
jgi:membrane associated rhomboid family serine protease